MKIHCRTSIVELFDGFSYNSRISYRQRRSVRCCIDSLLLALPFASADENIFDLSRKRLGVIELTIKIPIDMDWIQETVKDLVIRTFPCFIQ